MATFAIPFNANGIFSQGSLKYFLGIFKKLEKCFGIPKKVFYLCTRFFGSD